MIRDIFKKARAASPSIIFFDEIDAMTTSRGVGGGSVNDRILATLLNEMDGIETLTNVTILAATNRPDVIDSALLRPGRIDRIMYVGPPDLESRAAIFRIQFQRISVAADVNPDDLAAQVNLSSSLLTYRRTAVRALTFLHFVEMLAYKLCMRI
jgi:AAA family ATPase